MLKRLLAITLFSICFAGNAICTVQIGPGDSIFTDGTKVWPNVAEPVAPLSAEAQMLEDMIAMIACVDPDLAEDIDTSTTITPGVSNTAQVVNLNAPTMPGPGGRTGSPSAFTDSNTIGLDFDKVSSGATSLPEMAANLAHEFEHMQNGVAGGTMMDSAIYPGGNHASACYHAGLYADSIDLLWELACALPGCTGDVINCIDLAEALSVAQDVFSDIEEAYVSSCGSRADDMENLEIPWECCGLCGCSPPPPTSE